MRHVSLVFFLFVLMIARPEPTLAQDLTNGERALLERLIAAQDESDFATYIKEAVERQGFSVSFELLGTGFTQSDFYEIVSSINVQSVEPYRLSGTYDMENRSTTTGFGEEERISYTLQANIAVDDAVLTVNTTLISLDDPNDTLEPPPSGPTDYRLGDPLPAVLEKLDLEQFLQVPASGADAPDTAEPIDPQAPPAPADPLAVDTMLDTLDALLALAEQVGMTSDTVMGEDVDVIAVAFPFSRMLTYLEEQGGGEAFPPDSLEGTIFDALGAINIRVTYALNAADQVVQSELNLQGTITDLDLDAAALGLDDALGDSPLTLSFTLEVYNSVTYSAITVP